MKRKKLTADIWIIAITSLCVLAAYIAFGNRISDFPVNTSIPIVCRTLLIGSIQFGTAGLGISIVSAIRKESFASHGLNRKKLIPTILLSLGVCVPEFLYLYLTGKINSWCPFIGVNIAKEAYGSPFPNNLLSILVIAVCWGFFEGFNYVVIRDKISELYPSKYRFFDWGALVCAILCILIHGAVGVTLSAIVEMLTTMFLIYGMLIVKKETGNAWGCVAIFLVYWNAWS